MSPEKNPPVKPCTVTLPWPPAGLSPNARLHWAALASFKKQYRAECARQALAQGLRRITAERLVVAMVFNPPSRRRIDLDNCIARMKAGIDGLADVLGVDDSKWRMSFELSGQVAGTVVVSITNPQDSAA